MDCAYYSPRKREECGVFGVFGNPDAAKLTYFGLYALQHRGQESAGIFVSDRKHVYGYKHMGLVCDVFREDMLDQLKGDISIGHVRYSTTGSSLLANAQPFIVVHNDAYYGIAHNGNLVNAISLRRELESQGSIFQSTMDTEVFAHLVARNIKYGLEEALIRTLNRVKGAFSVVVCMEDKLIGIRDPNGFRPLCLGKLNGGYVLSSETCALDLVEATYVRDVAPGEIIIIDDDGPRTIHQPAKRKHSHCIFEFIYFARPDSNIFGQNVCLFRKRLGQQLHHETKFNSSVDFAMPFPDSGVYAALGFAEASGIPFEMGMVRNHYIGRTFIQPSQDMREFGVRVKLNPVKNLIEGKRLVLVEDSVIRGTTMRTRAANLRDVGAKEIHMLVSCPPHKYPCPYGIDFSTRGELIAASRSVEEIRQYIGLDSLHYLSLEGLLRSANGKMDDHPFCLACFNGEYPVDFDEEVRKGCFEQR
jgi:amidophosphoribosyltransferase